MKRRSFSLATLSLATATLLASCVRGLRHIWNSERRNQPQTVTVSLSGWQANPNEQALLAQLLQDFESQHPAIKVRYETIADQYMDVIKTRLIGDAAPDVFYLDVFQAPFLMNKKVLEPLDAYITQDFDLADFEPPLLNAFQDRGQIYGLPKDVSTLALFYNKKAFAEAGLSRPPQTWQELREFSKKLTLDRNGDGKVDQYGFGVIPELARQAFMIKAFGGRLVDPNGYAAFATEQGLQGLQGLLDQYRQDRSSAQKTDVGTHSGSEMFAQEKVAMVIEGNWAIPYLTETFPALEFGTAEVPTVNDQPGTMAFSVAYVMNQQAKHKAAAWQLIAYLTGKEGMKRWTRGGSALPSRRSVAAELGYDQDPLRSAFSAGVDYATPWQAGEYLPLIMDNFDNQLLSAFLGEQTLLTALQQAQATANREIAATQ